MEVADGHRRQSVGSREPHGFPGSLWEACHFEEETVQMDRVNAKFIAFKPDEGYSGKAANQVQTGRGFMSEWLICPPLKIKKAKDAVTYCSWQWDMSMYFTAIQLGRLLLVALSVQIIARIPGRPSEGVWVRMPPWVMSSRCWMNIMLHCDDI